MSHSQNAFTFCCWIPQKWKSDNVFWPPLSKTSLAVFWRVTALSFVMMSKKTPTSINVICRHWNDSHVLPIQCNMFFFSGIFTSIMTQLVEDKFMSRIIVFDFKVSPSTISDKPRPRRNMLLYKIISLVCRNWTTLTLPKSENISFHLKFLLFHIPDPGKIRSLKKVKYVQFFFINIFQSSLSLESQKVWNMDVFYRTFQDLHTKIWAFFSS